MFEILSSIAISFLVTFFCTPVIIRIANQKKLFDTQDERKIHRGQIAPLGGLAIFAGFSLANLVSLDFSKVLGLQYFIAAAIVILFLGLKDDILVLSPLKKLLGQFLAAFLVVYKGGIQIESMHGLFGIETLPHSIAILLTYFTVLLIINAFNLIDGVDGLAGSLGLMMALICGFYFFMAGETAYAILGFSLAGSLLAFLFFNFQPARIFMGDCGSLLVGLVASILVIKLINVAPANSQFPLGSSVAIGFSILLIPLLDTLRVFSIRVINRRSPFSADRNHLHHILLNSSMSHKGIALALTVANLLFVSFAFWGSELGNTGLVVAETATFFSCVYLFSKTRNSVLRSLDGNVSVRRWKGATKIVVLKSKDTLEETSNFKTVAE